MSARYAKTVVISHMKNPGDKAVKADFFMIIPDSAFISNLSMIIGGQEYVSEVKKAEEAAQEFDKAVSDGFNTAIVSKPSQSRSMGRCVAGPEAEMKICCFGETEPAPMTASPPSGQSRMCSGTGAAPHAE